MCVSCATLAVLEECPSEPSQRCAESGAWPESGRQCPRDIRIETLKSTELTHPKCKWRPSPTTCHLPALEGLTNSSVGIAVQTRVQRALKPTKVSCECLHR